MKRRIICPFHAEKTESLVQYEGGWFCYGACHKRYTSEEVETKIGVKYEYEEQETETEDLNERFEYIRSLPNEAHRGLIFPTDARGYFICWPNGTYYKYRVQNPGKGSKYLGPRGIKPPLFWGKQRNRSQLAIVEGEINALSVAEVMPEWDVCSPGSATMFNAINLSKYLTIFLKYTKIIVILDRDTAGTKGLIESKAFFLYKHPFVDYIQIKPDANEVLVESGKEELRKILQGTNRR